MDENQNPDDDPQQPTDATPKPQESEPDPDEATGEAAGEPSQGGIELPIPPDLAEVLGQVMAARGAATVPPEVEVSAAAGDAATGAPLEIRIVVDFRGLTAAGAGGATDATGAHATPTHAVTPPSPVPPAGDSDSMASHPLLPNHRPMSAFDPLSDDKTTPKMMPISLPVTLSNARAMLEEVMHSSSRAITQAAGAITDLKINELKTFLYMEDRRIDRG